MENFFSNLCRTMWTSTVIVNIFLNDRSLTTRTKKRDRNQIFFTRPAFFDNSYNIGNDFSAPLYPYPVMDPYLFFSNKIKIMQARSTDFSSTQIDWREIGNRCDNSTSPYLKINTQYLSTCLLCRKFICHSSTRMMIGLSKNLTQDTGICYSYFILSNYFNYQPVKIKITFLQFSLVF